MQSIGLALETVNIDSHDWELWYGVNRDMRVFTFVALKFIKPFDGEVKSFFNYPEQEHDFPAVEQYLLGAFLKNIQCSQHCPLVLVAASHRHGGKDDKMEYDNKCTNLCIVVFEIGTEAMVGGPVTFTVSHFSASVE